MNRLISRYLNTQKFDWLLADGGLYVSAAVHQLDLYEGKYDHRLLSRLMAREIPGTSKSMLEDLDRLQLGMQEANRADKYLSCWYLGSDESQKMWSKYGAGGVLIITDSYTLESTLPEPLGHASEFYSVAYNNTLKPLAIHKPLAVKNESFVDEHEYRLVFDLMHYSILTGFESRGNVYIDNTPPHLHESITCGMSKEGIEQSHRVIRRKGNGLVLNYSLDALIKEVRLHPKASDKELLDIESRLREKGIRCPVRHSSLRTVET